MFKFLFILLFTIGLFFTLPQSINAASQGKIGVGPIYMSDAAKDGGGIRVEITLTGKDISGKSITYKKYYQQLGSCVSNNTGCLKKIELPDGNDSSTNTPPPVLSGTETYSLSIKASRIASNGETSAGSIECIQNDFFSQANCGPWNLKQTNDTDQITYRWINSGAQASLNISATKTSIHHNESTTLTVKNFNKDNTYFFSLEKKRNNSVYLFHKQSQIKIDTFNATCNGSPNELGITCSRDTDNSIKASFSIDGSIFPTSNTDETYNLIVRGIDAQGLSSTKDTATQAITVIEDNKPEQKLSVQIMNSPIEANTDTPLIVRISKAIPNKKYDLILSTSNTSNPLRIVNNIAQGETFDITVPSKSGSSFLFTGAGTFILKAIQQDDQTVFGTAQLVVTDSSKNGTGGSSGTQDIADKCKKNPEECSKSSGIFCNPADGSPTSKKGILTAIGCVPTEPKALIEALFKFGTGIGGGISFLMMVSGAITMMTSGSSANAQQFKAGQDRLTSAVIGLLFIIFSVLLLRVIGFDILGINGWLNPKI